MNQLQEDIVGRVDAMKETIAELALELGNTYGPVGNEEPTAQAVNSWYQNMGIESRVVPLSEGRASTVGWIRGNGDSTGRSLAINAHLDTEASGPDFDNLMAVPDPNKVGAHREGDRLYGHTVQNDRGCMAIQMVAGLALQQSKAPLTGDLMLISAAGETGAAPVDEYQGVRYESKGYGTTFLLNHGYRPDYAIIAETTDFSASWMQCGAAYYKVTISGRNMYTPRLERPTSINDHPNAIVKAAQVIGAIEQWAIESEAERTIETPVGVMRPKAQVGAFRGGIPWRPNRSATYAALYVDVRTRPGESITDITRSLREAISETGIDVNLQLVMFKEGFGASEEEIRPLLEEIRVAHQLVRKVEMPDEAESAVVSMWRDTNVYNRVGIPALTFGPSRGDAAVQGSGFMHLDNMVQGAKIYALTALGLCT